ncbi:MAG: hypothetical protein R2751_03765 [Bacteroidales bacterium]
MNRCTTYGFGLLAFVTALSACTKPPGGETDLKDGVYLVGEGSVLTQAEERGLFSAAVNATTGEEESGLLEFFVPLSSETTGFQLVDVDRNKAVWLGPGADFGEVLPAGRRDDAPKDVLMRGSAEENGLPFSVPSSGLYHVVFDRSARQVALARVLWGLSGEATPGGSYGDTPLPLIEPADAAGRSAAWRCDSLRWQADSVLLTPDRWGFRYSEGDRLFLREPEEDGDEGRSVWCTLGGNLAAPVRGGSGFINPSEGYRRIVLEWTLEGGFWADTAFLSGESVAGYPDELYVYGGSLDAWHEDGKATPLIPVHSRPGAFWGICWLDPSRPDPDLRFSPVEEDGDGFAERSFGVDPATGITSGTPTTAATQYAVGSSSLPAPAEAGYRMVWVDLQRDSVSLAVPRIYLIGATLGNDWQAPIETARFGYDGDSERFVLVHPLVSGELRMHVWHPWHGYWWQHEFTIRSGKILYRGDGDAPSGEKVYTRTWRIELDFRDGVATLAVQ